jgi:4'-phosphopantetheinyl transferase
MQAVESETLILYHTDLRGEWPEAAARRFAARLPYVRRLASGGAGASQRASLAGVALALRALARHLGRAVRAGEIAFARGEKPRLAPAAGATADFSISHSGPWVACAALARGTVGLDVELGTDARRAQWVLREALLKATGAGLRALAETRALPPHAARLYWRGKWWHIARLQMFAGAAACVVSSRPLRAIEIYNTALGELFAA